MAKSLDFPKLFSSFSNTKLMAYKITSLMQIWKLQKGRICHSWLVDLSKPKFYKMWWKDHLVSDAVICFCLKKCFDFLQVFAFFQKTNGIVLAPEKKDSIVCKKDNSMHFPKDICNFFRNSLHNLIDLHND
jgi:hypothetical protein